MKIYFLIFYVMEVGQLIRKILSEILPKQRLFIYTGSRPISCTALDPIFCQTHPHDILLLCAPTRCLLYFSNYLSSGGHSYSY